jgi:hypothetical protein
LNPIKVELPYPKAKHTHLHTQDDSAIRKRIQEKENKIKAPTERANLAEKEQEEEEEEEEERHYLGGEAVAMRRAEELNCLLGEGGFAFNKTVWAYLYNFGLKRIRNLTMLK